MERIEELVGAKKKIAKTYYELILENLAGYVRQRGDTFLEGDSYWLYVLEFIKDVDIDGLVHYLSERGIETRRVFPPLNLQPAFQNYVLPNSSFTVSQKKFESGICLPSSTKLKLVDQVRVIDGVKNYLIENKNTNTSELNR
jgi:dTDP-4-amino-4,6-dideoxygalactose transaminase